MVDEKQPEPELPAKEDKSEVLSEISLDQFIVEGPSDGWNGESIRRFHRQLHLTALILLVVALSIHFLQIFSSVMQQLLIAGFISYLILPAHRWLVRRGVWPTLSYVSIVTLILILFGGLGFLIGVSFEDLSLKLPKYQVNISNMLREAVGRIPYLDDDMLQQVIKRDSPSVEQTINLVQSALGTAFGVLSVVFVVTIYLVFILAEQGSFPVRIQRGFETDPLRAKQILSVIERINGSISKYMAVKTLVSLGVGVFTTLVLLAFDVDYAVLWGTLTFLLNYIPYLGSIIATAPPVLLSLVQHESLALSLAILLLLVVNQNVIGYWIEPQLTGKRLDLSPLVIILALAFWGSIWGIVGMILAVPMIVVVKTIMENIPATKPFAMLLSNPGWSGKSNAP